MNGAMAELCARINSTANRQSVIRIGVIHQRLLLQKNENSSPAMPNRWPVVLKKPITLSPFPEVYSSDKKKCNLASKTAKAINSNANSEKKPENGGRLNHSGAHLAPLSWGG